MASGTTATSKVTPVTLGTSVRNKSQVFTATKVTETADSSGKKSYKVELVKFSDAKGSNPTTFGTRDSNGNIVFNNNASANDKQFAQQHLSASKTQMESVKSKFGLDSESAKTFNKQNGNGNKSAADNPQGDSSQPVDLNIESSGKQRDSFGSYTYPIDVKTTKQDVIKFTMLKYEPRKFQTGQDNLGGFAERSGKRTSLGNVVLPIPSGISESNGVSWGQDTMDPGQALLANIALAGIKGGFGEASNTAGNAVEGVSSNTGEVKSAVATKFAEAATGIGGLLSRTQGAIFNPNMELLFQGPTLRPFNFNFKMSARSKDEAKEIIKIIRFFKQGMSPQKSKSNLYLKSPNTFRIQYLHRGVNGKDHPFIGAIKECALQNFVVNYTPEGQYATFYDGVLVSYEIQMTFQELEPVFNEDYGNSGSLPEDLLFRETPPTK